MLIATFGEAGNIHAGFVVPIIIAMILMNALARRVNNHDAVRRYPTTPLNPVSDRRSLRIGARKKSLSATDDVASIRNRARVTPDCRHSSLGNRRIARDAFRP